MKLSEIILSAKLGRARKDAQVDCCGEFAAALFDALEARGIACSMVTAVKASFGRADWYHAVVDAGGRYYDSMGEFSEAIYRARAEIHPTAKIDITFHQDSRSCAFDDDMAEMHAFYFAALNKVLDEASVLEIPQGQPLGIAIDLDSKPPDGAVREARLHGSTPETIAESLIEAAVRRGVSNR